jgi:hypothetical protein
LPSGKSRAELLAAIETTVSKVLEPNARSARHGINEAEDLNFFFEDLTISEPKGHGLYRPGVAFFAGADVNLRPRGASDFKFLGRVTESQESLRVKHQL